MTTIKQEIQNHIKNGKIDTYGALLLIFTTITILQKVMNMTIPNEEEHITESKQNK